MKCAACSSLKIQDAKNHHLCTIAQCCRIVCLQLRHVSTIRKKNLLNSNISSTCPHNTVNFRPLTAEIDWRVFGAPQQISTVSCLGFVTAPKSLNGRQPNSVQCLAVSWAGTLYIHFWGLLPLTEFSPVQNSLYVHVLCSSTLTALQLLQGTPAAGSAKLCGVVQGMELRNFHRGRHLYAAGRPSRWASAHIVVIAALWNRAGHYIFACGFFLLSSFFPSFTFSSRRLDVYHTSTHGVTLVRI